MNCIYCNNILFTNVFNMYDCTHCPHDLRFTYKVNRYKTNIGIASISYLFSGSEFKSFLNNSICIYLDLTVNKTTIYIGNDERIVLDHIPKINPNTVKKYLDRILDLSIFY